MIKKNPIESFSGLCLARRLYTSSLRLKMWNSFVKQTMVGVFGIDQKLQRWSWLEDQDLMRETSLLVDFLSVTMDMMHKMLL